MIGLIGLIKRRLRGMDTTTLLIVLAVALVAVFLIKKKGGDAPAESATDAGDSQEPEAQQAAPAGEEAGENHQGWRTNEVHRWNLCTPVHGFVKCKRTIKRK